MAVGGCSTPRNAEQILTEYLETAKGAASAVCANEQGIPASIGTIPTVSKRDYFADEEARIYMAETARDEEESTRLNCD